MPGITAARSPCSSRTWVARPSTQTTFSGVDRRDWMRRKLDRLPPSRRIAICTLSSWVQRPADLPVVAERVDNATQAPAMGVRDGCNLGCAGRDGLGAYGCGIFNDQEHADRASAERLWAEVQVLRRFLRDPEGGARD